VVALAKDDLSMIVVNNRIDLVEESPQRIEIDEDTGRTWARDRGLDFMQTSCLRKDTVDEAFHNIIVQVRV
jgi:predicted GTPase